jgi:transcriptional regulator with XRE-family HTH domain
MRQLKEFSQEDMAEKLGLSLNGYANIERGETDVQMFASHITLFYSKFL